MKKVQDHIEATRRRLAEQAAARKTNPPKPQPNVKRTPPKPSGRGK